MPDPTAAPAAEDDADDDLGAALEAAWNAEEASTDESPEAGTETPSAPATTSSASSPAEAGVDAGRARGPDGKFVKADPKAAAAPQGATGAPAPVEFKIPEKWPAEVKQELAAIHAVNPAHAQFLLKQYDFMRKEGAQVLNRAQQERDSHLKAYNDLLAPGRQARALKGIDDTTHVRHMIAADNFLNEKPREGILFLCKQYGIDPQQLVNPQAGGQQAEIPEWAQQIAQKQGAIEAFFASQNEAQEKARVAEAGNWIDAFAKQKDANGQPLRPHFDEVLSEVVINVRYQMERGEPVDVQAAYDKAVRMNDSVWLKVESARTEASRKEAEARKKRDVEDAKRAGFSVSGSGAEMRDDVPDDIGKHLLRNWEKLSRS